MPSYMTAMALSAIEYQLDAMASNALAPYESPKGILLSTSVYKLKHLSNFESKCFTTRALVQKKEKTGFFALIVLLQLLKLANKNCDHLHISTSTWYIEVIDLDNACIWSHYLIWVGGGLDSYLLI